MRDWLSASDLAKLALPGLPASERGWRDHAERQGWFTTGKARERAGRGGGLEFHIDLLPPATLMSYIARFVGAPRLTERDADDAAREGRDEQLTLPAIDNRDARLALLSAADRYTREAGLSRLLGDRAFAALYSMGRVPVDSWVREACPNLSGRTLRRWRSIKIKDGIARLGVDKGAARRGKGILESAEDGKVKRLVLGLIAHNSHYSADHIRAKIEHDFPAQRGRFSLRALQRLIAKIEAQDKVALLQIRNPDKARSYHRLTGGTNAPVSRLNELWQIDASPADVLCVDGRHSIYACIDIFSRRTIIYVSRTPRAEAVQLLMRRAMLAWGVLERVRTDNGSDFKAKSTQRLFAALDIEVEISAPYQPQQKGHVERVIGTFQRDMAPLLPGFVGHNVADRKAIEERRSFAQRLGVDDAGAFKVELTANELQAYFDQWAEGRYAHRVHSAIKCAPFEMAQRYTGAIRRIDDIRALDLLLAPIADNGGLRTVGKRGVRINSSHYLTPLLPETRVFVRMDPEDMGRAWLFSEDGAEFLGEAVCPDLAGVNPVAALNEARAQRKALLDDKLAEARAEMRKIKPRDMVEAVVVAAAKEAGKLVAFPRAVESYTTPGLEAAKAALGDAQDRAPDIRENAISQDEPAAPQVHRLPETRQQRFRRARDMESRIANNERLSNDEALWLGGYQQSPEYRSMQEMVEEFGEAALH